jgi:Leucine-rich repeat (LRR) protein
MPLYLSKKNVPSLLAMSLTMVTLMVPADAQTVSCTSTSPECCWVVLSWQKMGKTTSVDPNSATACCDSLGSTQTSGISVVTCTSTGFVTRLTWSDQSLQGSIPPELENLKNLQGLYLQNNQLSGSIPPELGNLENLQWL